MPLFKNECLRDTAFPAHDLIFRTPSFGPRYGRHRGQQRAFGLSSAVLHGDDEAVAVAASSPLPDEPPVLRPYVA